jgi:hypothetical protein
MSNQHLALYSLLFAACGGGSIVGTWASAAGADSTAHITSVNQTLTFNSNKSYTSSVTVVYDATAPTGMGAGPSCTSTVDLSGTFTDSSGSTSGTLTLTPTSGTTALTGCSDSADDVASTSIPSSGFSTATSTYSISGSTLTLTSTVNGQSTNSSYNRQ